MIALSKINKKKMKFSINNGEENKAVQICQTIQQLFYTKNAIDAVILSVKSLIVCHKELVIAKLDMAISDFLYLH